MNSDLCFTGCQVKWDQSQMKVERIVLQLSGSSFKKLTLSSLIPSASETADPNPDLKGKYFGEHFYGLCGILRHYTG